jgi:hypothetical protein
MWSLRSSGSRLPASLPRASAQGAFRRAQAGSAPGYARAFAPGFTRAATLPDPACAAARWRRPRRRRRRRWRLRRRRSASGEAARPRCCGGRIHDGSSGSLFQKGTRTHPDVREPDHGEERSIRRAWIQTVAGEGLRLSRIAASAKGEAYDFRAGRGGSEEFYIEILSRGAAILRIDRIPYGVGRTRYLPKELDDRSWRLDLGGGAWVFAGGEEVLRSRAGGCDTDFQSCLCIEWKRTAGPRIDDRLRASASRFLSRRQGLSWGRFHAAPPSK